MTVSKETKRRKLLSEQQLLFLLITRIILTFVSSEAKNCHAALSHRGQSRASRRLVPLRLAGSKFYRSFSIGVSSCSIDWNQTPESSYSTLQEFPGLPFGCANV